MGAALLAVPMLAPPALGGGEPGEDLGWRYNCRSLFCLFSACTSGVGLGNIRYFRFGVNVEPSDRPGYDRMITQIDVTDLTARGGEQPRPFTELRLSIGSGGGQYAYTRRLQPAELGRPIDLPEPVHIRPGYRKYVGIYVDSNVPGAGDEGRGQRTGDCEPLLA